MDPLGGSEGGSGGQVCGPVRCVGDAGLGTVHRCKPLGLSRGAGNELERAHVFCTCAYAA